MKLLFFPIALCFAADAELVDCSTAELWFPKKYPTNGSKVVFEGNLYTNSYYADQTNKPGVVGGPWNLQATCQDGTIPDGVVDCSQATVWTAKDYVQGSSVIYNDSLYVAEWWVGQAETPGTSSGWIMNGYCSASHPTSAPNASSTSGTAVNVPTTIAPLKTSSRSPPAVPTAGPITPAATIVGGQTGVTPGDSGIPAHVFLPYVDVCLGTVPSLVETAQTAGVKHFILAFVVAGGTECKGWWGNAATVSTGPNLPGSGKALYQEIADLRALGGDIVASFGGAAGTELANSQYCKTADDLVAAYTEVLDKLNVKVLDFDIEGTIVSSIYRDTAWKNRFDALKKINDARPDIEVWYTLAVLPTGLVLDGINFVTDALKSGVRFDRLNLMTMDYGAASGCAGKMHDCEVQAVDSVAKQVFDIAQSLGVSSQYGFNSVQDVYAHLGSTPMIGVNDQNVLQYTLDDAKASRAVWDSEKHLGITSFWSLARDTPCSGEYADPTCSGANLQSNALDYAKIYADYGSA